MKHIKENKVVLESMFSKIFNTDSPAITFENGELTIGNTLVIYETEITVKRIGGEITVPGYGLSRIETKYFRPDDEPVVDMAELAEERVFVQIAKAAVVAWCEMLADAHIDRLDCEAQARELFG